jgi:DNA repair protein RecO (recombination protein O)
LREVESESPPYGFDCAQGGVLCDKCALNSRDAMPLSLAALKVLRRAARVDWPAFASLNVRPLVAREVEQTLLRYITYVLERNLKSVEFLRTLRLDLTDKEPHV